MKRIFAKCFLQKHNQNVNHGKKQTCISKTTNDQETPSHEEADKNHSGNITNPPKLHKDEEDKIVQNGKTTDAKTIERKKDELVCISNGIDLQKDKTSKKIWEPQKQLLHPFKPDLVPPGSPAKKRIRQSRSNSRLSFICLEAAEDSDDEENSSDIRKGNITCVKC